MHDDVSGLEARLLRTAERMTTLWVLINPSVSDDLGADRTVQILHGHYRDWFAEYPRDPMVRGRMAYFGLIRRYKNVDALLRAFRETDRTTLAHRGREARLHTAGGRDHDGGGRRRAHHSWS